MWKLLYMFRVVFPPIIRSSYNCIYSIWYLSHRYWYLTLSWKSWNRFECAVDGVSHPQHTQTAPRFRLWYTLDLINPLNAELNSICHLLILLGDLTFVGKYIVSIFQYSVYPTRCNVTQFIYIRKLLCMFRVVFPPIIRSAYNCIYSIWYLSHRYCYLPLTWKSWNRFECAVGVVRHPQHTQTSSNSLIWESLLVYVRV